MTITITITGDARTVRNELHELIGSSRIYELPEKFRDKVAEKGPTGGIIETPPPAADAPAEARTDAVDTPAPLTGEVIPPEDKPRRGRRSKADAENAAIGSVVADYRAAMEAEQAAPMTAAEAEKVMHADAVVEEPKEIPLEAVQNAIRDVAARFDTDACKALLTQFGAAKSSEVKPEDRAAFVQAAKEWKR